MANYQVPGGVFDLGDIYRNVSQLHNRNALTRSQIGTNELDNQYRQAQINSLNQPERVNILPPSLKDFTAESVAEYERTGNRGALKRYVAPKSPVRVDAGDAWELYNPLNNELIKRIPKQVGPEKTPEHAGLVETAKQDAMTEGATDRKKNEALGTAAAKQAEVAFAKVDQINGNLKNLDDAIAALESGAQVGPISDLFPSVRQSTIELLNVQSRLGLDVVGAVTFGALSKGELDLALQTALPTKLDDKDLLQWVKDKSASQAKLSQYFNDQAVFLSQPGNTQADWLEYIKTSGGDPRIAPVVDATGKLSAEEQQELDELRAWRDAQ